MSDDTTVAALRELLDPKTLPILVADILELNYGHTEIRITDGPGDGGRDVHSRTPNGRRHVAQCKYHEAPTRADSARDVAELPMALMKFGVNAGVYVTTGWISPQGKRELLDDYSDFELLFLDGNDLLNEISAHPTLSAIWLRGEGASARRRVVTLPFIVRESANDRPVDRGLLSPDDALALVGSVERGLVDKQRFVPYRAPANGGPWTEDLGDQLVAWLVRVQLVGDAPIASSARTAQFAVARAIAQTLPEGLHQVRVGTPSVDAAPVTSGALASQTLMNEVGPATFVATQTVTMPERDWLLPPERLGVRDRPKENSGIGSKENTEIA